MNTDLPLLIDTFAGLNVLVLGEAMLDSYLEGTTGRYCPEAPAPVVARSQRKNIPGGAANTAVNVQSLGGRVAFLSVTGADTEGMTLRQTLAERGIAIDPLLTSPDRRTLAKQRVVVASQILLRLDEGSTEPLNPSTEAALIGRLVSLFPHCDAVIVSDYRYGLITPRVLRTLADLQARWSKVLVVDARLLSLYRHGGATAVKPNYEEALGLLGARALEGFRCRADGIAQHGERLLELSGAALAAVTLDNEGAMVLERGRPSYRTYAHAIRQACVAGAGDTFTSTLALALAAGASAPAAAELATAAASVVVGKERTATCSAPELREFVSAGGKYVADLQRLAAKVEFYRQQGRRIVLTNGCFDILH
ncbi:MAG TPA: PfkB family carbohydrate kinase, partial [Gemmataceae bacterium]|nr:PfkB family carbohydrate kinase [Gemmataceae bacterium]